MAENSTSFKKNNNANPVGRPKGSFSPINKAFKEILNAKVPKDMKKLYNNIIKSAEAGESWANELFWKKFVPDIKQIDKVSLGIKQGDDIDTIVRKVIDTTGIYQEYTFEELLKYLSILTKVKFTQDFKNEYKNMTLEELRSEVEKCNTDTEKALEFKI